MYLSHTNLCNPTNWMLNMRVPADMTCLLELHKLTENFTQIPTFWGKESSSSIQWRVRRHQTRGCISVYSHTMERCRRAWTRMLSTPGSLKDHPSTSTAEEWNENKDVTPKWTSCLLLYVLYLFSFSCNFWLDYLSICLSVSFFLFSFYFSVFLFFYLSIYLSIYLSLSSYLAIYLSISS